MPWANARTSVTKVRLALAEKAMEARVNRLHAKHKGANDVHSKELIRQRMLHRKNAAVLEVRTPARTPSNPWRYINT